MHRGVGKAWWCVKSTKRKPIFMSIVVICVTLATTDAGATSVLAIQTAHKIVIAADNLQIHSQSASADNLRKVVSINRRIVLANGGLTNIGTYNISDATSLMLKSRKIRGEADLRKFLDDSATEVSEHIYSTATSDPI